MKKIRLLVILIGLAPQFIFAESFHTIRWKGIPSASAYSVELKDPKGQVTNYKTKKPEVTLKMNKGVYQYRVGVLNKLSAVEKWSEWHDLEVKSLAAPVVDEDSSRVTTEGGKEKIYFTSENVYEGTKAFVIQNGKKIPAKVETTQDGKTSIVIVDRKLVDPTKDHKVVLTNAKYEPIEVLIPGELVEKKDTEGKLTLEKKEDQDFSPESGKSLWSMLWRQAVLPGWGHQYAGHEKTSYVYYGLLGGSLINLGVQESRLVRREGSFRTAEDISEGLRFATEPFQPAVLFYMDTRESRLEEQKQRVNQSLVGVGAVYSTALLHILYTGTKNSLGTRKLTFWEMLGRQILLPGWGHDAVGDHKTAYFYYSLMAASLSNLAYQNYLYRKESSSYRTEKDLSEGGFLLDPSSPFFLILMDTKTQKIEDREARVNRSLSAVGAIYATSILHIMLSAHLKRYIGGGETSFFFGIRPDDQVYSFRPLDWNQVRADIRLNFYF
ncbi:hypothetical protein LPTSP4_14830 [Leptospira ryugenii]|uniref:DUF5683 domain-containing protein n=1 Tax=Leptospira ryugenii TaxID=1917863 RepID=A0A2P2DZA7_9LEPT|nr:hypothetical protein [Leptospira ryugenii]GBF49962.1 hypothetical protein LPTSP4_14830 [Leptospira ryugenii]